MKRVLYGSLIGMAAVFFSIGCGGDTKPSVKANPNPNGQGKVNPDHKADIKAVLPNK